MTKVGIIVPVYNSEKFLDRCLNSLVNQTLDDIEIVVVNDGSVDNSQAIIDDYKSKYSNVISFKKKNGGQASARNLALTKVSSENIMFVDSDDYIELNACEKLYDSAISNNSDIVACDYYITSNNVDSYHKVLKEMKSGVIEVKDYFLCDVGPCNKLFKLEFLKNTNFSFPEGIIYEDYAAVPTLIKYNPNIYYLNQAFLHYVQTDSSTMRTIEYKEKYEDIFPASNYLYESLKDCIYKEELENLITYHLLYLASLNFYKYKKYSQIDKIADFMKSKFPKWKKNKYINNFSFKQRVLMYLFYHKKYYVISFVQRMKGGKNEKE